MTARVIVSCDVCGRSVSDPFPTSMVSEKDVKAGERIPLAYGAPRDGWSHSPLGEKHVCAEESCREWVERRGGIGLAFPRSR